MTFFFFIKKDVTAIKRLLSLGAPFVHVFDKRYSCSREECRKNLTSFQLRERSLQSLFHEFSLKNLLLSQSAPNLELVE